MQIWTPKNVVEPESLKNKHSHLAQLKFWIKKIFQSFRKHYLDCKLHLVSFWLLVGEYWKVRTLAKFIQFQLLTIFFIRKKIWNVTKLKQNTNRLNWIHYQEFSNLKVFLRTFSFLCVKKFWNKDIQTFWKMHLKRQLSTLTFWKKENILYHISCILPEYISLNLPYYTKYQFKTYKDYNKYVKY